MKVVTKSSLPHTNAPPIDIRLDYSNCIVWGLLLQKCYSKASHRIR